MIKLKIEVSLSALPLDLVLQILSYLPILSTPWESIQLLTLSRSTSTYLEPFIYSNLQIFNPTSLIQLNQLFKSKPSLARYVHSLWISPLDLSLDSDFFDSLSENPPQSFQDGNHNSSSEKSKKKVLGLVRNLLRSCRKLIHLALDGGLLSSEVAPTYGSASQPLTLFSINPKSYLNGFQEIVFRKVRVLRLVDTSLVDEEIRQIQKLQALESFTWSLLKEDGDSSRDARILLRLTGLKEISSSSTTSALNNLNIDPSTTSFESTGSRKNVNLKEIILKTTPARRRALGNILRIIPEEFLENPDYLDSKNANGITRLDPISQLESNFTNLRLQDSRAQISGVILKASLVDSSLIEDFEDLRNQICPTQPRDRYYAGLNLSNYYQSSASTLNSNANSDGSIWGDSNAAPSFSKNHESANGNGNLKTTEEVKVEEQPDGSRALKAFRNEWRSWIVSGRADRKIGR